MTALIILGIVVFSVILVFFLIIWTREQNRKSTIEEIKQGTGVVSSWVYTPEEWSYAAKNHFDIQPKHQHETGRVCFTERYILAYNRQDSVLFELIGSDPFSKHLTEVLLFKDSSVPSLRFEVRTKKIKKDEYDNDLMEEDYKLEVFNFPIPQNHQSEQDKVFKFYKALLEQNTDAVAAVMPYGLGLFKS